MWLRCVRSERWPCVNRLLSFVPVHEISMKTSRNPIVRNTWISMVITTHCLNPSCWWLNYNRFSIKPKYHMISLWSHSISSISQRWQPLKWPWIFRSCIFPMKIHGASSHLLSLYPGWDLAIQHCTCSDLLNIIWLVVSTPLKNMSSSVGIMKFPTEWKVIKIHGSKAPTRYLINHY